MTDARDYSATLFLPQTDFPMRAGLPAKEPEILARWERLDLYRRMREAARGKAKFILHDGPPYANGSIHLGTALNKILKDVVTRSQQMLGYDSNYVPGWDCHGLPIEWKIEEENYRSKGKVKPDLSDAAAMIAFRKECRAFAEHWLEVQRNEFKRLGVEGDWGHPYTTMSFAAEAQIARELMTFAANGTLYRGSKPVMWSVVEKTALAEAEVEYEDYVSDQVWVKFPVRFAFGDEKRFRRLQKAYKGTSIVIWTTTPWTIPGNRAISYSPKVDYVLIEANGPKEDKRSLPVKPEKLTKKEKQLAHGNGVSLAAWADGVTKELSYKRNNVFLRKKERLILAKNLVGELMNITRASSFKVIRDVPSEDIAHFACAHPLNANFKSTEAWRAFYATWVILGPQKAQAGDYSFVVPLLAGDHVADDAGTGFVHTAPGHGREDFDVWTANARELEARGVNSTIPYTVDENGAFTDHAPGFTGARVLTDKGEKGDANNVVTKVLTDNGMLIARGRLKHQYPHSWRSKKPVIFRNTPQWFIAMDRDIVGDNGSLKPGDTLRHRALSAIEVTKWVPPQGENRITGMIESRPDWVISRQRAWGVPIAVFVREKGDGAVEILQNEVVNKRIGDAFEAEGADAWYAAGARERFLGSLANEDWKKVDDILDVWFDSGSTHAFVLEDPRHFPTLAGIRRRMHGGQDTVMYLEGSDQHRGWFQSSLLESCGTRGVAPFDVVLTHGFILDEKGVDKMSKSRGNTISPQEVMATHGADILRLWVTASDYTDDIRFGPEILKNFVDTYRKLRNTLRWMLGNLAHFQPEDRVEPAAMPELERLMLHRLAELDVLVRQAYVEYDYKRIFAALNQLMTVDLSAFYFDIRKDALYCDPYSSVTRKAALTVIDQLFRCTVTWLAPMLCFTAEEAWVARYPGEETSVHLELFPEVPASWRNAALAEKWAYVREVRRAITEAMEIARAAKKIGSSLEAHPVVEFDDGYFPDLLKDVDMAEVCITSAITIRESAPNERDLDHGDQELDLTAPYLKVLRWTGGAFSVIVRVRRASGRKCARSWKISGSVGSDPDYPDVTPRDAQALREWDAIAKAAE